MANVLTEIIISKPLEEVVNYAINPDNAPEWYNNIETVEWKTLKPLALGFKIALKAHFLGKGMAYVYEITELIPDQKLVMRSSAGSFTI